MAEYIQEQADKNGKVLADGAITMRSYLTHQEIAICRHFTPDGYHCSQSIRDQRLLDFDLKRIIIRNPAGLKAEIAEATAA